MQALQPVTGSSKYVTVTDQCEPLTFRLPSPPNNGRTLNGDVNTCCIISASFIEEKAKELRGKRRVHTEPVNVYVTVQRSTVIWR